MSKTSGLYRVGRDCELRYLNDGTAVANISLAFNHGTKDQDGNRKTQWVEGSLFGKRAEVLAPFLLKGSQHVFHLSDAHIETYRKADGSEGFKMAARVDDVELTDRRDAPQAQRQQPQAAPRQAPPQRQAPQPQRRPTYQAPTGGGGSGFDDMDSDDIPF
jgi:single-strand DNA-binding protein